MRDFNAPRLFVDAPLLAASGFEIEGPQANYLLNVLRLGAGDRVLVFNGRDGEWRASISLRGKRTCVLTPEALERPQEGGPDIDYLFAPLKRSRLDYMVQKATELGVARLRPVLTRRTNAERVNIERMRANVIEAAEQCGILRVPEVAEPVKLEKAIAAWDAARTLIFCDEAAAIANPIVALEGHMSAMNGLTPPATPPLAVLIGPEGGFDAAEREMLLAKPFTLAISLGPRIMRADTAAVAALALVNAATGDWR